MSIEKNISGIVVFSLIIVFGWIFLADISSESGIEIDEESRYSDFNEISNMKSISDEIANRTSVAGSEQDTTSQGNILSDSWKAIKSATKSTGNAKRLLNATASELGVPSVIINAIIIIIVLFIIFAIVRMVL